MDLEHPTSVVDLQGEELVDAAVAVNAAYMWPEDITLTLTPCP
jgi:hypothetical protein